MDRMKGALGHTFWIFSMVAIVFLAPSYGFITLTIPDEPYGSVVGVPDNQHLAKRTTDDLRHIVLDAASLTRYCNAPLVAIGTITLAYPYDPHAAGQSLAQIRGPPDHAGA